MKHLTLLLVSCFLLSCSVDKKILIKENRKTKELSMFVDPTIKQGGIGLYIIKPVALQASIHDPIKRLIVNDENGKLLWEVEYINQEYGGYGIHYGKLNTKQYIQIYPKASEPIKLERDEIYTIIMIAKSGTYKKRFIYQEAEIKITNHDLIVNQ